MPLLLLTLRLRAEWNAAHKAGIGVLNSVIGSDQNVIKSALNAVHIHLDLAYTKLQNMEALAMHFQQLLWPGVSLGSWQ